MESITNAIQRYSYCHMVSLEYITVVLNVVEEGEVLFWVVAIEPQL